jgi:hypothetical protein
VPAVLSTTARGSHKANWLALGLALSAASQLGVGCGSSVQDRLFTAVWDGDTNNVASLLSAGAQVNVPSRMLRRETPLIDAVRFGHIGVVQLLLARGANPNIADREGHGPLYHALTSPYLGGRDDFVSGRIVSLLLTNGASVSGRDVMKAINDLGVNDSRLEMCQEAIKAIGSPARPHERDPPPPDSPR